MSKYTIYIVNNNTLKILERMEMTRNHFTNDDFKMLISSMFEYAATDYTYADLTTYIFNNDIPRFTINCKTTVNGSTITTDFSVNNKYIYTKTAAC